MNSTLHTFVWESSCGGSEAVLCLDKEVQVAMCKQTDHSYVCILLTVKQAYKAKNQGSCFKNDEYKQTPCIQACESSKPTSISVQKICIEMIQLEDSGHLLNMCE